MDEGPVLTIAKEMFALLTDTLGQHGRHEASQGFLVMNRESNLASTSLRGVPLRASREPLVVQDDDLPPIAHRFTPGATSSSGGLALVLLASLRRRKCCVVQPQSSIQRGMLVSLTYLRLSKLLASLAPADPPGASKVLRQFRIMNRAFISFPS